LDSVLAHAAARVRERGRPVLVDVICGS
jgi:hypothetical protein